MSTDSGAAWQPGERVLVYLPRGPRGLEAVPGTVREVDPPGLRPGVRVDLDYPVRGADNCYATHSELRKAPA